MARCGKGLTGNARSKLWLHVREITEARRAVKEIETPQKFPLIETLYSIESLIDYGTPRGLGL